LDEEVFEDNLDAVEVQHADNQIVIDNNKVDMGALKERTVNKNVDLEKDKDNETTDINKENDLEQHLTETFDQFEKAKILSIFQSKVAMFVPGAGIKQFLFSNIFLNNVEQTSVYENYGRQSVVNAINGFNSCLLC